MRHEDFRPSSVPCGVGQAGAGPRHLLSPPIALPASTGVPDLHQAAPRSLGLKILGTGLGWADGWAPPAPAPRGYSQGAPANGCPQGQGPGGGLDKCSEVSRCYRGQRAELLVTEHPPLTSCPGPVSHARGDVCACLSCSLKAMPGLILSWPRHNLPTAGVQHPCPSGPLRWWRVPVALLEEPARSGPGPRGVPACAQCLPA